SWESKRAARLRLCRAAAACPPSRRGGGVLPWAAGVPEAAAGGEAAGGRLGGTSEAAVEEPGVDDGPGADGPGVDAMPVHLLICFCRYLRWLTFRFDLPGLSRAILILQEAESMKLSRSRVASLQSPAPAWAAAPSGRGTPAPRLSSPPRQPPWPGRSESAPGGPDAGDPGKRKGAKRCGARRAACTAMPGSAPNAASRPRGLTRLDLPQRLGLPHRPLRDLHLLCGFAGHVLLLPRGLKCPRGLRLLCTQSGPRGASSPCKHSGFFAGLLRGPSGSRAD
uniref:Uncharacterized protein n=1 Tax=Ornithorhynchus anatinus TaxID=9258 RepID=A0A6I8NQX3_ORNAN